MVETLKRMISRKKQRTVGIYAASDLYHDEKLVYRKGECVKVIRGDRREIRRKLRKFPALMYDVKVHEEKERFAEVLDGMFLLTDGLIKL